MDYDVMNMVNDAIKTKYTNMISDLIEVVRSSQNTAYLSHKQTQPQELTEVHAFNTTDKDSRKMKEISKFDIICSSNP